MAWDWDRLQKKRSGPGPHPPDMDEMVERFKRYRGKVPGVPLIAGILFVIWVLSGIYIVAPDEIGVVKRFGSMVYTTTSGPHYHLPYPIESVMKPTVTKIRRVEIGFRTVTEGPPARYQAMPDEALMLTGDENIVDIQFIVQYRIKDAAQYLFNVINPDGTVKDVAEAAMRQVVGRSKIDEALTTGKFKLQQGTKQLLQTILDIYEAGIAIDAVQLQDVHPPQEVIQAFKDVASAKEDKVKYVNDAEGYSNDILPKANGQAAQIVNEALAYQQTKINHAQGDANRFLQTLVEFSNAKEITKKRMYLETMEEVLERAQKVIISEKATNLLPILPLKGLQQGEQLGEESGKEEK